MSSADGPGQKRVRQLAEWTKKKYAGSFLEQLWDRLKSIDVASQGMLFAATLLLCFIPFVIIANALSGRSAVTGLVRRLGLDKQAAAEVGHLFISSAATSAAVTGTTTVVFFVLGGTAAASALQGLYEQIFNIEHRGMKDIPRRLIWLAVLTGSAVLAGWGSAGARHAGPVALGAAGLLGFTLFWWFTMWFLLAGRLSWPALFPCALATGVFWVGMEIVFSLFFSSIVISNSKQYGLIGIVFALMAYLIAIGVVVILGAVAGLVWQERGLSIRPVSKTRQRSE